MATLKRKLSTPSGPEYLSQFSFTPFLRSTGVAALASTVPVCSDYASGHCALGRRCPNRHPTPEQMQRHHYGRQTDNYVCKHWLKGLCKKGDACDYLHEYNLRKMSECQFYNQHGYCQNGDECLYLHVKEEARRERCAEYDKGFCVKGPACEKRHVRRRLCVFFMAGFCPDGKECRHGVHLKVAGQGEVDEKERERRTRVEELERREEEAKRENRWRDKRGGRGKEGGGGRWRNKRER